MIGPRRFALAATIVVALPMAIRGQPPARDIDVEDFNAPDGYVVEPVVTNLSVPTTAIFDGDDLLIAESGTKNTAKPRVLRVKPGGAVAVIASEGLMPPVTGLLVIDGKVYVSHKTKVSIVEGGTLRDIVTDLPSLGDHQNNQIVLGPDGKIYIGQGTVTNSGVVGLDNDLFGWMKEHPEAHEVPCQDIVLNGETFETDNPLTASDDDDNARTSPYKPFGVAASDREIIKGHPKCGGSIARFDPDGSGYEVVAWGLRNPFGLTFDSAKRLWATSHGADVRGSRNVFNDPDYVVQVAQGQWYGWPDFFDGEPVSKSRFNALEKPGPRFL